VSMPSPTAATTTMVHTPGSAITPHHSIIPTTLSSPVGSAGLAGVPACGTGSVGSTQHVANAVGSIPGGPASAPGKVSLSLHR
jgi:hypothetical protein